jgi:AcrR family transcriptional regulator
VPTNPLKRPERRDGAENGGSAEPQVPASALGRRPGRARDALVGAAAEQFNTVGYYGTDSNRIARAAGYAPGTFYNHFPNKLAIFLEVYENWVTWEWQRIREAVIAGGGDLHAVCHDLVRRVLDHHRKWRVFRASLRALSDTDPDVREARLAQRERQLGMMAEMIRLVGARPMSKADMAVVTYTVERACDAVADGDFEALGVSVDDVISYLEKELTRLFNPA